MRVATISNFLQCIKSSPTEVLGVVYYDLNEIAGIRIIGEGTATSLRFNFKDITRGLVDFNASGMTLIHNHPHGAVRPSVQDLEATYKIIDLCKPAGVRVRDHLILGGSSGVYSFTDNDIL